MTRVPVTKVAVTTDRHAEVAPVYGACGLDPVPLPTIQVDPAPVAVLKGARRAAESAPMLLVTSSRTVRLLWPDGGMPPAPVAAVGEVTAAAVEAAGGRVAIVGRTGLADLADQMLSTGIPERVVFPRAAGSDPMSLTSLLHAGVTVVPFDVYRSVPVAPAPSEPIDAVAFASPSAVEGWALGRTLDGLVVAVIGSTTHKAVSRHRPADVVAPHPSHEAMAEALASYMEVRV